MIEHKDLVGMPIYELDRLREMAFENQKIKPETESLQGAYAAIEIVPQHKLVVRFVVDRIPLFPRSDSPRSSGTASRRASI